MYMVLATAVRDAEQQGSHNNLAKMILSELIALVRTMLCPRHNLRLSVSVKVAVIAGWKLLHAL